MGYKLHLTGPEINVLNYFCLMFLHIKSPCRWWKLLSWWDYFLFELVNPYNPTLSAKMRCFYINMFAFKRQSHLGLLFLAGAGESFNELTVAYLQRLKEERGIMLAVCTGDYGEMSSLSQFCSYNELKYAFDKKIDVLPLRVGDEYPPNPPGGKGHLDKHNVALGYIAMVFPPSRVYLDCRNKSVAEIASEIAAVLRR